MSEIVYLLVPVLLTIFVFAIVKAWMDGRVEAANQRVRLLEEALKNPAVDRAMIETLTYQLTGGRKPRQGAGVQRLMAAVLAVGWVGLFTGIGIWVFGEMTNSGDAYAGGIITTIASFGLVTYPFALRELEIRRAQP
jgi:hypothetical protein